MHNTPEKNIEFQITWCENNLGYLAGEPASEERTRKENFMKSEIVRLNKSLAEIRKNQSRIAA